MKIFKKQFVSKSIDFAVVVTANLNTCVESLINAAAVFKTKVHRKLATMFKVGDENDFGIENYRRNGIRREAKNLLRNILTLRTYFHSSKESMLESSRHILTSKSINHKIKFYLTIPFSKSFL